MKIRYCAFLLAGGVLLAGCAQAPVSEPHLHDPSALPYVNAHGVSVEVQLPPEGFVSASMVIDAKTAQNAMQTSDTLTRSAVTAGGWVGLLAASAINTQAGIGALERDARVSAQNDARPMAALLGDQSLQDVLQRRYREASQVAGLKQAQGPVGARLLITPQLVLSGDRSRFVLVNRTQVQDIAGSVLYQRRIEVLGTSFRRCGEQCVDDGRLDQARVNDQLQVCIAEAMRVLTQDLQVTDSSFSREETIRYVLDGQRMVERGQLLPASDGYHRYRNLDGALKSVPVAFEGATGETTLP